VVWNFTKGAVADNIQLSWTETLAATASGEFGMGIRRAKRDRWIWGVCGGIAHHFGWSSTAVRLVVVLLAIFIPGVSVIPAVLIYILLGYLLPETEEF
jgi:phage shock protein C